MKNCLGIEIGNYRIKIAYMEKGVLKECISERIEEGAKPDARLCAETIRDLQDLLDAYRAGLIVEDFGKA